ncbi:hypothetical protein E2C01_006526 [Portunus trituberculatus]|uniref:Uncharacterized protein n=1 Tax=Portunus trituberculatus TaxID=210409 RepID=A0A5B7CVG0_PORTR|nr:hypothetical protein [Portunus trituberculatus]
MSSFPPASDRFYPFILLPLLSPTSYTVTIYSCSSPDVSFNTSFSLPGQSIRWQLITKDSKQQEALSLPCQAPLSSTPRLSPRQPPQTITKSTQVNTDQTRWNASWRRFNSKHHQTRDEGTLSKK